MDEKRERNSPSVYPHQISTFESNPTDARYRSFGDHATSVTSVRPIKKPHHPTQKKAKTNPKPKQKNKTDARKIKISSSLFASQLDWKGCELLKRIRAVKRKGGETHPTRAPGGV